MPKEIEADIVRSPITKTKFDQLSFLWIKNKATIRCNQIDEFNWNDVLSDNVDSLTSLWSQSFLEIMKICVPQRSLRSLKLQKSLPWITGDIVGLIKERNFHFLKAKKSNDPIHFALYKSLRNQIVGLLRVARKDFFNSLAPTNKVKWPISGHCLARSGLHAPSAKTN